MLYETADAFCVPTLGPIVEGHCLVFSKRSVLNLTLLDPVERRGYAETVRAMAELVETAYGPSIIFEHGAIQSETRVGCGIDRAHLHLVPGFDVFQILAALDERHKPVGQHASFPQWLSVTKAATRPYMLVGSPGGPVFTYEYGGPRESQCIRRVLATLVGRPESWDWHAAKDDHLMERTLETLRGAAVE